MDSLTGLTGFENNILKPDKVSPIVTNEIAGCRFCYKYTKWMANSVDIWSGLHDLQGKTSPGLTSNWLKVLWFYMHLHDMLIQPFWNDSKHEKHRYTFYLQCNTYTLGHLTNIPTWFGGKIAYFIHVINCWEISTR